jgi:hypothetical protein
VNASFLRREWGAVTFVLTVFIGVVAVPLALYFGNQSPTPVATQPSPTPAASSPVGPSPTATPR